MRRSLGTLAVYQVGSPVNDTRTVAQRQGASRYRLVEPMRSQTRALFAFSGAVPSLHGIPSHR